MPHPLAPILDDLRSKPSRTWSIVVTLFGDAVVPRGGSVWLGTLLAVFAAMGIGANVVRTAMSRLAADGWLVRTRLGRNSFYHLAPKGTDTFAAAAARIYAAAPPPWDGALHLAILPALPEPEDSRAVLRAANFAPLLPGTWLRVGEGPPVGPPVALVAGRATDADARALVRQAWPLDALGESYQHFLNTFRPLGAALDRGEVLGELDALAARTLLVHEYRRIVLRDPLLPDAVLPRDWPGLAARDLCAALYRALLPPSEHWLDAHALAEDGPLPPPGPALRRRFAGTGEAGGPVTDSACIPPQP